jgi:hypothetical protein
MIIDRRMKKKGKNLKVTHRVSHAQEAVVVDDARSSKRVGRSNGNTASHDRRDNHGGSRNLDLVVGGLLGRARHCDVLVVGVLGRNQKYQARMGNYVAR